ncbi:MAG: ADP-ribosylglycohydrolase family protein [Eubacteriales bacterium]
MKRDAEHFRGCLAGGAVGDALGYPVEFMNTKEIQNQYGPDGISSLQISSFGKALITDDTQMTLFTAEGILRAQIRGILKGICYPPSVVYNAYRRWLFTQVYLKAKGSESIYDGWLLNVPELHQRRAPGNTCISALAGSKQGSIEKPINNSKGCGGVMRAAPAGLFYPKERSFDMAAQFAVLTHGHPSGYLSAGALAYIIASVIEGHDLETAVNDTLAILKCYKNHDECSHALSISLELSESNIPDIDAITKLGEGWVGEEAIAISVYCALKHKNDFKKALIATVNHNGDSDSTGAITGNILGAYLGYSKIPADWTRDIELLDVLIQVSDDLLIKYNENNVDISRYPGY